MFKQSKKSNKDTIKNSENRSNIKPNISSKTEPGKESIPHATSQLSKSDETIIGEEITIDGSIRGKGNLIIEGIMKGTVEMDKHNFTVGSKGRVEGEILAKDVIISGVLHGDVKALGQVKITQSADFNGKIIANSISIENGAFFKGEIELEREPHGQNTPLIGQKSEIASKKRQVSSATPVEDDKEK